MAKENSRFVVIGLGRFGGALARRLAGHGHRVTGIDISDEAVKKLENVLTEALVADGADEDVLRAANIGDCEAVFISMGDHANRSTVSTMYALEMGAPRIIVKGIDALHAKILHKLGKVEVIFPEEAMARYVADHLV